MLQLLAPNNQSHIVLFILTNYLSGPPNPTLTLAPIYVLLVNKKAKTSGISSSAPTWNSG